MSRQPKRAAEDLPASRRRPGTVAGVENPDAHAEPAGSGAEQSQELSSSTLRKTLSKRVPSSFFLAAAVLLSLFATVILREPSGYGVLGPGPVVRLTGEASGSSVVDDGTYSAGWFAFTTVNVDELSYFEMYHRRVVGGKVLRLTSTESSYVAKSQMEASKNLAASLALTYTSGFHVAPSGVLVLEVALDSPASRAGLHPGDVIAAVDGVKLTSTGQLRSIVEAASAAVQVTLGTASGSKKVSVMPVNDRLGIVVTESFADALDTIVSVDTSGIGGPSAGLLLTLSYVDALSPGDLTAGLRVAGTGTVDSSGKVGEVAGAPFKLAAAQAVGAHVFFTPAVLEDELAALPHDKVRLVPVSSVGDALYFLCASGATDAVCSKVL